METSMEMGLQAVGIEKTQGEEKGRRQGQGSEHRLSARGLKEQLS